ncbi:NAD(P)-binding domain-containing protein, partial [Streptomyces sp.]
MTSTTEPLDPSASPAPLTAAPVAPPAATEPRKAPKDPWDLPDVSGLVVGVLGGTGEQGRGLAYRFAKAGQKVVLGSRAAERAREVAAGIGLGVEGADNAECARRSDV